MAQNRAIIIKCDWHRKLCTGVIGCPDDESCREASPLVCKPPSDKWAAISNIFHPKQPSGDVSIVFYRPTCPAEGIANGRKDVCANRPDSDVVFECYPEIAQLSEKWVKNNVMTNAVICHDYMR